MGMGAESDRRLAGPESMSRNWLFSLNFQTGKQATNEAKRSQIQKLAGHESHPIHAWLVKLKLQDVAKAMCLHGFKGRLSKWMEEKSFQGK